MLRFALHFAFAYNMSKIRAGLSGFSEPLRESRSPAEWKTGGLNPTAGPIPVFPSI